MNKYFVSVLVMVFSILGMNAQELKSPNGNFKMIFALENDGTPTYQLFMKNKEIIKKSKLGLELQKDKKSLLNDFKLVNEVRNTFDETWNTVWGEETEIRNHYNEMAVTLNQKAQELGCVNTHFVNASGMPDENQ